MKLALIMDLQSLKEALTKEEARKDLARRKSRKQTIRYSDKEKA